MPRKHYARPPQQGAALRQTSTANRNRLFLAGAAIVLLTCLAYSPFLANQFIWDDNDYVYENKTIAGFDGLEAIWVKPLESPQYYPMVFTSFWLEHRLWGFSPLGYHVVNILLHAASSVLLWRMLSHLKVPWGWLAGAIFAVHPVHVESVAWITERKNVLSGLFYLLAAMAYFRFSPPQEAPNRRRWDYYAIAVGLFICALLSKTVTCTLPAALLVVLWWKRDKLNWRDLAALAPMLVIGAAMGLITAYLEKKHVLAEGSDWSLTFMERFLVAGRILWFYASKLFWPHPLIFIYHRWTVDGSVWWQYLFPAAVVVTFVSLFLLRRRIGKGPLTAVAFFAGTLFPALGFFNVYPMRFSYVADHFQYLASIGIISLFAATLWKLRAAVPKAPPVAVIVAPVAILAALAFLTCRQAPIYHDVETLWQSVLERNYDCWVAHTNLGDFYAGMSEAAEDPYAKKELLEKARGHYFHVARLIPQFPPARANLGLALLNTGHYDEAIEEFTAAIKLDQNFFLAYNNMGIALQAKKRYAEALPYHLEAVRLKPDYGEGYNNLGVAYDALNKLPEAAEAYHRAVELTPNNAICYINYAKTLAKLGKNNLAIDALRQALRLQPNNERVKAGLLELTAATSPSRPR